MSDLSLLLPKYQHLDPSKHSFNDQFGLIRKRTAFQNFLHRLICILTFGLRSDNPLLDRATQKLIRCAEDVLSKSKGNAETMRELDRILRLHISVVRHNAGTGKTKLWELLSNINSPHASAKSSPVPRQKVAETPVLMQIAQAEQLSKATRLMQFLDECRREENANVANLPEASEVSDVWPGTLALLQSRWSYYSIENIPYYLLKVTQSLMLLPETERRRSLCVVAKLVVLSMPSLQSSFFQNPAWWDLFAAGDCAFQALTIKDVLHEHLHNSNRTVPYMARLSSASLPAWQKAGEMSLLYLPQLDRLTAVIQGQRPESLIAYLNGVVSNPSAYKKLYFTHFFGHMIQPHRDAIPVIETWSLDRLSEQAWELFDSNYGVTSSFTNVRAESWENKDFLWYQLSRHLNHPQTDSEKKLFVCFSPHFLKRDPNFNWDANLRSFFEALTPADISVMPLEKYLPTHRFLLALRSQSLQRYGSLLKTSARNLTAQELTDLLALCQRYPISIQDKIALVNLINEPSHPVAAQPVIVQHWMQEISAHMDPLLQRFTGMVDGEQWEAAWDFVQGMDEMTRNYFLGPLRLQTLPAASEVKDLSRPLFFMALFDPKAYSNMQQMLQDGMAEDSFTLWINEMVDLSRRANLPENVFRNTISAFVKGVKRSAHVGSLKCPLRDQYKNPSLADITVKLPREDIPAHRALLRLDPFFNRYISLQNNEVTIPPEKVQEAHLRLKWLYNSLTMREIVQPATQQLLREVKNNKPSFEALFNRQETDADIIVKGADDPEGIHAHRFLLASAFPFFRGLFENKMGDSATLTVTLREMTLDQVKAALEYLYTGERPEFADQQSEDAFKDIWNFLKSKQ